MFWSRSGLTASLAAGCWAASSLTPAWAVAPDALALAPADAPVVMIVPSLSGLSQKLAMLNDALGLNVPQLGDALGQFKTMTGMREGLNDDGSFVLVMSELPADGGEPKFVMLAPVVDYDKFVGNYGGDPAEPVAAITMPEGQSGFVKAIPGYAVLGPDHGSVEAFKPGESAQAILKAVGPGGEKYLSASDAAIIINIAVLEPTLRPKLAEAGQMMEQQFAGDLPPGTDPQMAELGKQMAQVYINVADAFLRDTQSVVIGLDIGELGAGMSATAQFEPDSYLAKQFVGGGDAAGQLAKLPKQPYLFASAMDFKGIGVKTLLDDFAGKVNLADAGPIGAIFQQAIKFYGQTSGVAQAYYAPQQANLAGGLMNSVSVIETDDAPGFLGMMKAMMAELNNLKPPAVEGQDPGAPEPMPMFTTSYNENQLQIDGVQVDQYTMQMNLPPEAMAQAGPMMMLGFTNYSGYIAAAGNHIVSTTTPDTGYVKSTLASIKAGNGLGDGGPESEVRAAAMPEQLMAETYISLSGIANTANLFMGAFGMGVQLQVPENLSPIASGVGVKDGGMAGRLYVPMDAMRAIKGWIEQVQQMQQGAGGGNPGGGPPPAPH